jgi:hypothetical protein
MFSGLGVWVRDVRCEGVIEQRLGVEGKGGVCGRGLKKKNGRRRLMRETQSTLKVIIIYQPLRPTFDKPLHNQPLKHDNHLPYPLYLPSYSHTRSSPYFPAFVRLIVLAYCVCDTGGDRRNSVQPWTKQQPAPATCCACRATSLEMHAGLACMNSSRLVCFGM